MERIKLLLKRILILYVILFLTLSLMSSCFARGYDKKCGEFLAQYAVDFCEKYGNRPENYYDNSFSQIEDRYFWTGGSFGSGAFHTCCTVGIRYMYYKALEVDICEPPLNAPMGCGSYDSLRSNSNWVTITNENELEPGDIVYNSGHAEMIIQDGHHVNFGNDHPGVVQNNDYGFCNGTFKVGYRLSSSVQVNPTGTVGMDAEEEDLSIYDENGFIYSGVAKIQGYKGSLPFGKWIIKMLTEILDYLIGILTLGIRIVIVGWTAIIERVIIDGLVNGITGITNKKDDSWEQDPNKFDEIDREVQEEEAAEAAEIEGPEATGDESNPNEYISEGMQGVADIGGNIQLNTDSRANVTIENIVYNKIPILDINFFNFESAGGAVVDEDGIIYIIKENVAMWYYIFRTIAIIIMLMVLIYLGIKMSISTVAEKRAVYKEMLTSWIAGFILVFAINYIMYGIIYLNETFISWIIPKYEDGSEISLYESVRSKAYEIKATTGFAGMIMYIILVYYGLRFLIVYFKRYLTITILALMSPFVAVLYAINKINKKGKGGEVYGNWMKDFLYTVWLQSIHALIYTLFIQTVLQLTEVSILGIFIAFIFLHYMTKMDGVMRNIFGFNAGKNASKLAAVPPLMTQVAAAKAVGKPAKKIGSAYGNFIGKTVGRPLGKMAGNMADRLDKVKDELTEKYGTTEKEDEETAKKRKKEQEERKRRRQRTIEGIKTGAKLGTSIAYTGLKGALVIPMLIVEAPLGIALLGSTVSSTNNIKRMLQDAKKKGQIPKATSVPSNKRYKLKGVRSRNQRSADKLRERLDLLGIKYRLKGSQEGNERSGRRIIFGNGGDGQIIIGPTGGYSRMRLKDISFSGIEDFIGSEETLSPEEGLMLLRSMDKDSLDKLDKDQRKRLAVKLGVKTLRLTKAGGEEEAEEELEEMIEEGYKAALKQIDKIKELRTRKIKKVKLTIKNNKKVNVTKIN